LEALIVDMLESGYWYIKTTYSEFANKIVGFAR
jgi:hypothetical protein